MFKVTVGLQIRIYTLAGGVAATWDRIDFSPYRVIVNLVGGDLRGGDSEHLGQKMCNTL
jgi:hypothetical protein